MTYIITIDGPSGSGKGTLAAKLAQHYAYTLLDSGAIYRLLGLSLFQQHLLDSLDADLLRCIELAKNLEIAFVTEHIAGQPQQKTYLFGQEVSEQIRSEEVGGFASRIAVVPELRAALLQRQRDFAQGVGLVADGRDMGTLVFPQAQAKLYLTASAQSRAERRVKQLQQLGQSARLNDILAHIEARDYRDMTRSTAPLQPAEDAFIIDSSKLSIEQVFTQMVDYVDAQRNARF